MFHLNHLLYQIRNPRLASLIASVGEQRVKLEADDVFRISVLISSDVKLELVSHASFMNGFLQSATQVRPKLSSFQLSQVQRALGLAKLTFPLQITSDIDKGGSNIEVVQNASALPVSQDSPLAVPFTALARARSEFGERHHYDRHAVSRAFSEIDDNIRQLHVSDYLYVLGSLTALYYQDYRLMQRLTRRGIELAPKMTSHEACVTYNKLRRLSCEDSLIAILNRIAADATKLPASDASLFIVGLEVHSGVFSQASSVASKVLSATAPHAQKLTDRVVVAALIVSARYGFQGAGFAGIYLKECIVRADLLNDRHIVHVLRAASDLALLNEEYHKVLTTRLTSSMSTFDIRLLDKVLDVVSRQPFPVDELMKSALKRLETDAAQLQPVNLANVLDILSSYPPAFQCEALAGVGYTVKLRAEAFGRDSLTIVVTALFLLGFRGYDLFDALDALLINFQGFKSIADLVDVLKSLSPQELHREARLLSSISFAVQTCLLTGETSGGSINPELKREMARLGLSDRVIVQQVQQRKQALTTLKRTNVSENLTDFTYAQKAANQNASRKQKKNAPFNFKKAMWDVDI